MEQPGKTAMVTQSDAEKRIAECRRGKVRGEEAREEAEERWEER